ncbi:MAG: hypothetical protein Q8P56_04725 [Candidatus Uhrbacteria bacterium]|nr:hypothetical protein [Candidatus Uhrbacteria bacterium]
MTPTIIGICGPTSTGKTSLAKKAATAFEEVTHVPMDDFFKDEKDTPLHGDIRHWNIPESVHLDQLVSALTDLQNNTAVEIPLYSKPLSARIGTQTIHPSPVILVEGTLIYSSPEIRNLCSLKIFIRTTADTILSRYASRIKDYSTSMRYLTDLVFPTLDEYTEHYSRHADVILDGTQSLEQVERNLFSHLTQKIQTIYSH